MAETFKYVQGDTGPQLQFTLTDDATNLATDLTSGTVDLHFRAAGAETILFTRRLEIKSPPTAGIATVVWHAGDLDQPAGSYRGELEIIRGSGVRETLYDVYKFKIREDFA